MSLSNKIGVLIFPAGEINSIELCDALSKCVNIRLYGGSSVDRHGEFVFENYISGIPNIKEPSFINAFNKLLLENKIDLIIPTHDDIALFLAQNQEILKTKVLTCDIETAEICRDKKRIYEMFADCNFCPKIYADFAHFPVFIKPRKGQGGVGGKVVNSAAEIPQEIALPDYVICEYLSGDELTVDCFTDKDGNLQAVLPRSRQRVFGGVSVRSQNEMLTDEIKNIAGIINSRLKFLGLWYFQVKCDAEGNYKLLEISARCAGTMCLSRAIGVNLPLLSVYAAMGKKTEVFKNNYNATVDRTLISRYKTDISYDCAYIDFDDTIIVNNKVNLQAVQFLYQCINKNTRIFLITRHQSDSGNNLLDTLKRYKLPQNLFNEIIELSFDTPKYAAIKPQGAIFIDNAYTERKAVYENLRIPVFDVDGIEVLLDWRL